MSVLQDLLKQVQDDGLMQNLQSEIDRAIGQNAVCTFEKKIDRI